MRELCFPTGRVPDPELVKTHEPTSAEGALDVLHEVTSNEITNPRQLASVPDGCRRLGDLLGLDRPVPEAVLHAAATHPGYAHHLEVCRNSPDLLQRLLSHPPSTEQRLPKKALLERAARAIWGFAKSGFAVADDSTLARRIEACRACPHLRKAPETSLYKLVGRGGESSLRGRICALCGCAVAHKARMASEVCPATHPEKPDHSRWNEPKST